MSCSTHRRRVTRDLSVLLILFHVFLMFLPLTLAEEINNEKMILARSMGSKKKSMCLRQLESPTPLKIRLKMNVRPIGPGSNFVHIAGAVDIPTEELEVGGDWAPLHYEYTSVNQELYLNMTLKGKPLTYIPNRPMYHLRYDLEAVKMHVMGRVEIIDKDDCSQLETTTTTTTLPVVAILPNPAAYTMTDSKDATSWVWVMGTAGSVPILIILVILLMLLVVVVVSVSVILWRRRKAANNISKNKSPFAACHDPLMPQPQTADQFSTNNTNVSPLYRSPPPPPPPNYYSE
ncbi:uncharacterized protein LOC123510250 [Portunus trituberculatus]|uniref:uncharacterized protein LOC123510250 n=1 Tax=Portunus trituberculatus TaxID=210409 RepID=UPI001E1D013D|nr:uncharacterized protein LOC123510250 [Portunus trituberculatus]